MAKTELSEDELELQAFAAKVKEAEQTGPDSVDEAGPDGSGSVAQPVSADAQEPESDQIERPGPGRPPKGYVPHAAFHEERASRKKLQEDFDAYRRDQDAFRIRAEERIKFILDGQQQRQQPQPEAAKPALPDPNADPIGYMKAKIEQLEAQNAELSKGTTQTAQQFAAQQRAQAAMSAITQDEAAFAAKTPDYYQAADHLKAQWMAEAAAAGVTDQQVIGRFIQARMFEVLNAAAQSRRSPAEITYALAAARGYAKAAPPQQGPDPRLENLQRGAAAAKTLSGGATQQSGATPTAEMLLNMTEEEFAAYRDKHPMEYRRIMSAA